MKKRMMGCGPGNLGGRMVLSGMILASGLMSRVLGEDLQLASVFSDSMVLQREMPVPIWGRGNANEKVTVVFAGQTETATADGAGKWMVRLKPLVASAEPQVLTVSGSGNRKVERKEILVGEVWLASGQSNMEWEMDWKPDSKADIAGAQHASIRLLQVPLVSALAPQERVDAKWEVCQPESVRTFSAVGYYFGLRLHEELKVPVGIIQSAWGGTAIEPWTTLAGMDSVPALSGYREGVRSRLPGEGAYSESHRKHREMVEGWLKQQQQALEKGESVPNQPAQPESYKAGPGTPTALYNAMIHPLTPYAIRGAIWYQGESNHGEGLGYVPKKEALLKSWRKAFERAEMPFYFVQIAPYQYGDEDPEILARFWVAQRECMKLPQTGMAVITDIAEIADIHPAMKKEVARRLSLWAMSKTYGKADIDPSGPIYESMKVEGDSIRVKFLYAKELKSANGEALSHFEVAGSDGVFVQAVAKADGSSVVVRAEKVAKPTQVRFGWSKLAMPNLVDEDGLPACAFHSHWPIDPDLGTNVALGKGFESSDANPWGWNTGLTDGVWGNRNPQCFATGMSDTFPKHVTIDLGKSHSLHAVRTGTPDIGSTKTVAIGLSEDGKTYREVGRYAFPFGKSERHMFEFSASAARYVRLSYLDYHDQQSNDFSKYFGFTSEVEAFSK